MSNTTPKPKCWRPRAGLRASAVKAPVLLIHGTENKIVSLKQSRIMAAALKAAGKSVEQVEIKGPGPP